MKNVKKVAKAITYLTIELLDMGDNFSSDTEMLCDDAGVEFDTDCDAYYEDENYVNKKCIEAYEKLLVTKPITYMDGFLEYLYDCSDYLKQQLKYEHGCKNIFKHPIFTNLMVLNEFVNLEENVCSEEKRNQLKEIVEDFCNINMRTICVGYEIASEFYKYLDKNYYFISNTSYTIGGVPYLQKETEIGQYVAHASLTCPSDFSLASGGYAVAFREKDDIVVANLYEMRKSKYEEPYVYTKTEMEIRIDEDNMITSAIKIAEAINVLSKTAFVKGE